MPGLNQRLMEIGSALKNSDQFIDFKAKEDLIKKILELKEQKKVLILGHNYMEPLVYNLSEKNERGDSLALSMHAANAGNPIILFDGVRFMAETAKILNPEKKVLIADLSAGCSLADGFKAKDVIEYKEAFPNAPVVTYINSYAETKAESDYCCTSSNCLKVVLHAAKEFDSKQVIFLPDSLMGENIQSELKQNGFEIELVFPGKYDKKFSSCEVHEKIDAQTIKGIRKQFGLERGNKKHAVIVHWECKPEVLKEADFFGSTSQMIQFIKAHPEIEKVYLGTECEMTANIASEFPSIEFARTCQIFCQHMRKITLEKILHSLEEEVFEIIVPEKIIEKARKPIQKMLEIR